MKQIHKQKVTFVPDLAQRPCDRHIINQLKIKIWGGAMKKKEIVDLHADLKQILEEEYAARVASKAAGAGAGADAAGATS